MQTTTLTKEIISSSNDKFNFKEFILITLIVSIWINASEIFRYFVIVRPMVQEYLSVIPNVAPMNLFVFSVWGVWDAILTALVVFVYWLVAQSFGHTRKSVILAATTSWLLFFVLFWLAMINMALAPLKLAFFALPLAWFELVIASWIAAKLYSKKPSS
jgi:hypothetical protein